ncbi:MAG: T9SS type A sorting domain-containing protein, partial [Crocinitomicaceae bacterium]|nr:T9SS type A sorting domain-containing protein [Crocinitomicaceae bacterium]
LVGYWNFEEGSGTATIDQTINGNDGILNGGVTWSTDLPPYNCCTTNPITSQPTDQTVNMGNDASFTFTDNLTAATYQWQMDAGTGYSDLSNAGQFSGTDSDSLIISTTTMGNNNTNYRCIVTESASCMDTTDVSTLTVIDNTSIGELNNSLVKLFPNPSNDIITLTLAQHSNGQLILTDILGKEVLSKSFISNEVQLNLKSLASKGTYFVKVLDSDGNVIAIKKLIYQ